MNTTTALVPLPVRSFLPGADRIARKLLDSAAAAYRRHRTRRALMQLSDWHRVDCGLHHVGVPSATDLEIAARRRLELGMPTEWC